MITWTAITAAIVALVAGIMAALIPAVSAIIFTALTNLIAFMIVLPVKWTIEALHRYWVKRSEK